MSEVSKFIPMQDDYTETYLLITSCSFTTFVVSSSFLLPVHLLPPSCPFISCFLSTYLHLHHTSCLLSTYLMPPVHLPHATCLLTSCLQSTFLMPPVHLPHVSCSLTSCLLFTYFMPPVHLPHAYYLFPSTCPLIHTHARAHTNKHARTHT